MTRFLGELPLMVVEEQVTRLTRAFPGKLPSLTGFTSELREQTRGWTTDELGAAVASVIRAERHFPRIAVILRYRPEQAREEREDAPASACRQCGVEPYAAGYETGDGRIFGRTRCGCGGREPGWHTPRARAWVERRADGAAA